MASIPDPLRLALDQSGLAVAIRDGDGRYLGGSVRFMAWFGLAGGTLPGAGDADLFAPAAAAAFAAAAAQARDTGQPVLVQQALGTGNEARTVLVEFAPRADGGTTMVALDVTGQARINDDMLESRALFKGILDIAADAVISVDERQRIILFNQGAERIFGYGADEVVGRPLNLLLPPEARAGHGAHVAQFRHAPETARRMGERGQICGRRKSGEIFPAEASISRIVIGRRTVFTAILRDVTREREAEAAIRALNEDLRYRAAQLELANRELEAFSYSVSHDLRTPLRGIDGFSQVLLEDYYDLLPPAGRDALERVRNATQRMGQLIDDILNLSRVTRGDVHREEVDLSAMAEAVVAELRKAEPERRVEVVIATGMRAEADPHLIRVVLVNLLGNSWKFTAKHDAAHIEMGCRETAGHRRAFYVRDDGAGFDMAYADKLFGAFQRLHGATEYPGTGVGLATVQRIIHKHGGEVRAEAAVERGATFIFTLG